MKPGMAAVARHFREETPRALGPGGNGRPSADAEVMGPSQALWGRQKLLLVVAASVSLFVWAYWTTLVALVEAWNREPDYSHGFLVVPLAIGFLWARRDRFPGWTARAGWIGLILIGLSVAMRVAAARYYLDALDGWSILFWVAGVVWLFWGFGVLRWALPSIAFLWFAVPLPFRAERALSLPLQGIATKMSCWTLQLFGEPAMARGNTILLGDQRLEVEQACSGLRIFMGIVALAFAYVIVVRRSWWEKAFLLLSAVPIALIANTTRIVGTALLYEYVSVDAGKQFAHDAAGWAMIVLAAGLFALVLWYLGRLVEEAELVDVELVLRQARDSARTPGEGKAGRPQVQREPSQE